MRFVSNIAGQRVDVRVRFELGACLGKGIRPPGVDQEPPASGGERASECQAKAARGPGDQRDGVLAHGVVAPKALAAARATSSFGTSRRCCEMFQRWPKGS